MNLEIVTTSLENSKSKENLELSTIF